MSRRSSLRKLKLMSPLTPRQQKKPKERQLHLKRKRRMEKQLRPKKASSPRRRLRPRH